MDLIYAAQEGDTDEWNDFCFVVWIRIPVTRYVF